MTRAAAIRRLAPLTSWLVLMSTVLGVSAAVAWAAGSLALAHLRPGAWDESLASALVADYRAAEAAERFVPVSPSIVDDIARDEAARSAAPPAKVIAPIFVAGEGNQLPSIEASTPDGAATSAPGKDGQLTPHPTNTPKPGQTPPGAEPTAKPTNTPKPAQTPAEQPTPKPTNTPKPAQTPPGGLPTAQPTNTPKPAQTPPGGQPTVQPTNTPKPGQTPPGGPPTAQPTPPGGQPTARPTQPHPTPPGGSGGGTP